MSGLSVIRAGPVAEALEAAQFCPFLEISGILDVSAMFEISDMAGKSTDG
jgi:hypothetical protein